MKKSMKRIAALALVVVLLCLTLCACGAKKPKGTYEWDALGVQLIFKGNEVKLVNGEYVESGTFEMEGEQIIIYFEDRVDDTYTYHAERDIVDRMGIVYNKVD